MTMDGDGVIEIPAYQQLMVPNALWPTMARVLRQHNLMLVRTPSLPGDQPVSLVEPVYAPTEVDGEGSNATGYEPGTYGCHEALHTTLLLIRTIDRELADHPSIMANPVWQTMVDHAGDVLAMLYQEIGCGSSHLANDNALPLRAVSNESDAGDAT